MSDAEDEEVTVIRPGKAVNDRGEPPAETSRIWRVRERLSQAAQRIHEWRYSQWRRHHRNGELFWKNLCGGYVHITELDDGWRCWIDQGDTDYRAGQHCPQHAPFDVAVAIAYFWMEYRLTPQTSMDGRPFVPIHDGRPLGAVMGNCSFLYLDDYSDIETLLKMLDKRTELETLREEVEV